MVPFQWKGGNATLEVDGALAVQGSLTTTSITDNTQLAFVGDHPLNSTPHKLDSTLQLQNSGPRGHFHARAGQGRYSVRHGDNAQQPTTSGVTIINQGTINAAVTGGPTPPSSPSAARIS